MNRILNTEVNTGDSPLCSERREPSPVFFKVLVVDDEPMAVKAIGRIIERSCPAFCVSGEALNGRDALRMIEETRPDLVITDIEMPVMNGLEMARRAKEEDPDLCFVVISGYQDYEYMREALRTGVLDYLAKPIVPSAIIAMMERVRENLHRMFYMKRNSMLRSISRGQTVPERDLQKYFRYKRFYAALVRENGLPRRFSRSEEPELFGTEEEVFCVYGRDSMEQLFLIPALLLEKETIESYMDKIVSRQRQKDSYVTLLYYSSPFTADRIGERIQGLYHWLNLLCTVGKQQSIDLDKISRSAEEPQSREDTEGIISEIRSLLKTKQKDKARARIQQAYDQWEKQEKPLFWLESTSRLLMQILNPESGSEDRMLEMEYLLEDAFYYATDMKSLRENLLSILYKYSTEKNDRPKVDSPEFFSAIEEYLKEHMGEQLSLPGISDEFAISQTYMSRLFRKYAGQSFSQYLTKIRMERAKQLLHDNPGMYVRDAAMLVGYQDQFYFSRIFRSYTGKSPADFIKETEDTR